MMNPFFPGGMDPSKMNPEVLMKLSQIVRELPSEQLNRMQQIMHNLNAGFDVRKEMEEFERGLPPGFKDRLAEVLKEDPQGRGVINSAEAAKASESGPAPTELPGSMREARLTLLRAVASGQLEAEEAERLLFPEA